MNNSYSWAIRRFVLVLGIAMICLAFPVEVAAGFGGVPPSPVANGGDLRSAPFTALQGAQPAGHTRLVFETGVTDEDRELITEAARLAEDFFSSRFGTTLGERVTITALPLAAPNDSGRVAQTQHRSIAVFAGSPGWARFPPAERMRTVIHEYTHAYQYAKAGQATALSATWIEEGAAEYLSMLALADLGLEDREVMEGYYGLVVQLSELPELQEPEGIGAFQEQSGDVYPLAYLGVALLMQDLPLTALDDYYTQLQQGRSFALAFETSFGTTPAQFYANFADYRAIDMPVEYAFPGELEISEGRDLPSPVVVEEVPGFVMPGQQALVVVDALPGANCTLSLMGADATIVIDDRDTFANGVGRAIWLLSIPAGLPAGSGAFTIVCGADPATVPVLVA